VERSERKGTSLSAHRRESDPPMTQKVEQATQTDDRPAVSSADRCRFGLYEFEFRSAELRRDGQPVKLSPQPSRVLALLLARPGEIVLRDELRSHLWGDDTFVDFERGLNFCILQVRGALGDSSDNPRFVQTVPRKGYRFIAPVTPIGAPPAAAAEPTLQPSGAPTHSLLPQSPSSGATESLRSTLRKSPRSRTALFAGTAALVVVLAGLMWLADALRMSAPRAVGAEASASRVRVVILPVVNLTGEASGDYLADGLTDELIAELGQLSPDKLAVIARTSAMSYRQSSKTVAQIGQELGVRFVVESSLRREGDGIRIGSSLVAASDQTPLATWSETFGSGRTTGAESQAGAAIRMARLVARALLPDRPADEPRGGTANATAWNRLIEGRALMNGGSAADVRRALAAFEAATETDPALAAAWAKQAEARHVLVMMGAAAPVDTYPAAREAATRAITTNASLADAQLAQGIVQLWFDWRPSEAGKSFERALALNASSAAAHHDYAWALAALGRGDEAVAHITAARDLDPLSVRANNDIGWLYLFLKRPADAARACQHTLAIQPEALEAQACLERAYALPGLFDAALQAARAGLPPSAASDAPQTTGMPAEQALHAIWRRRASRLEEAARSRWISPYTLAVQHVLVGDRARALDELRQSVDQRIGMMAFLEHDPAFDPLRTDPAFQALVSAVQGARR
jgi:TolB-like protein/DNA-binding winged helix-turn-helix (wHTH) protein/Flp pilus assembly protein TadD